MERISEDEQICHQHINIESNNNNQEMKITFPDMLVEMKKLCYLTGQLLGVVISQYLLQMISIMMVGHLGDQLSLASTGLAISIAAVTGFSFLVGMACALETLCGQAYGAGQYKNFGVYVYTSIFCLTLICIPISILWLNMGRVLILFGQDHVISHETQQFLTCLVPALFAYAPLQSTVRYFQMQSMIFPLILGSFVTICFHVPICWVLVFKSGLRSQGAAVAMGLSCWLNTAILGLYMKYSPRCNKTHPAMSMEAFHGITGFLRFGIPSALMVCLEWWSFELVVILSGRLPNPQLETSVLSICLNTNAMMYTIPTGLSAALSTRVSNELGAGNSRGVKMTILAGSVLAITDITIVVVVFFSSRNVVRYIFSNEKQIVHYVKEMTPLLCISMILDGIQGSILGVARGSGFQHIVAYVNFVAFYLFGIPIAIAFGFLLNLRGKGLWIGIISGLALQSILLIIFTSCIDWAKQAIKARERALEDKSHPIEELKHLLIV
ncbi:transporter [Lithospermum erythrorhizon]|uniref:Protein DETOXIFICATION n=1 Tax=Lithospermum erythrorhizon TaxID=34254 RepID=A0AAV3PMQ5_LITER